jgi:hypothetical protein
MKAFPGTMTLKGNYRIAGVIPYNGKEIVVCRSIEEPDKRSLPIPLADFHRADVHPLVGQEYFIGVIFDIREYMTQATAINVTLTYHGLVSIATAPGEPSCVFYGDNAA